MPKGPKGNGTVKHPPTGGSGVMRPRFVPIGLGEPSWVADMKAGLRGWQEAQEFVSGHLEGATNLTPENMRTLLLAMHSEVDEWGKEIGWKPWKPVNPGDVDVPRMTDEFADLLAFMGLAMTYMTGLGVGTDELVDAYVKKSVHNIRVLSGANATGH